MYKTLVTQKAPFFNSQIYNPVKKMIEKKALTDYAGKYLLLTFYPLNFTFVCPTEIIALNNLVEDFKDRNCEVLCCSVDSVYSHQAWT